MAAMTRQSLNFTLFPLPDGALENGNFQGDCAEMSLGELISSHPKPLTPCLGINSRGNKNDQKIFKYLSLR